MMLGIYGWALISATQKLYYNLIITSVSSLFALFIALIQILGMAASSTDVSGPFWDFIGTIADDFEFVGCGLVVAFILGWVFAAMIYYGGKYHLVDIKLPPITADKEKEVERDQVVSSVA